MCRFDRNLAQNQVSDPIFASIEGRERRFGELFREFGALCGLGETALSMVRCFPTLKLGNSFLIF
jgi:hypothetical protein